VTESGPSVPAEPLRDEPLSAAAVDDASPDDAPTAVAPAKPKPARARTTRTRAKAPNTTAAEATKAAATKAATTKAATTKAATTKAATAPTQPATADTMPEPVETRSSSVSSSGSGDLGDLIRLLIPDDPTTGPVPIPPPGPETGPMLLPPIEGPFTPATATTTPVHPAGPSARPGPSATDPSAATTAVTTTAVTTTTTFTATATDTAAADTAVPEASGPADRAPNDARQASTDPEAEGPKAEPEAFTVVGMLSTHGRRRWAWARWLRARWVWLLTLPVVVAWSLLAGRRPSLRWSLAPHTEPKPEGPRRLRWFRERGWRRSPRWSRPPREPRRPGWAGSGVDVTGPVYAVAFSPDARRLATASGDGTIRLWNITDPGVPRQRWTVRTRFAVGPAVAFSPDGVWLATGYDTSHAALWQIDRPGAPVPRALLDHPAGLTGLHFSADGRRLVGTFAGESARVWDVTIPTRPRVLGRAGGRRDARAAAMFPDGRWLATAGERVEFWDVSSAPVRRSHLTAGEGPLFDVAVAPDGRTLAVGREDGAVDLWHTVDPSAPAPRASIDAHAGWVTTVEFGSDGRWLATVSAEHIALWDLTDPTVPVGRLRAKLPITAVAFSPARGLLAVAGLDGMVTLLRPTAPIELSPPEVVVPISLLETDDLDDLTNPANRAGAIPMPNQPARRRTTAQGAAFGIVAVYLGLALAVSPRMNVVLALVLVVPAALGLFMVIFWWPTVAGAGDPDAAEADDEPPAEPRTGPVPTAGPAPSTGPVSTAGPVPSTEPKTDSRRGRRRPATARPDRTTRPTTGSGEEPDDVTTNGDDTATIAP
jgi:hypothetical protein